MSDRFAEVVKGMEDGLKFDRCRAIAAAVLKEAGFDELVKACREVEAALGPNPSKCGCEGCAAEAQIALDAVRAALQRDEGGTP